MKTKKILIVEDDKMLCTIFEMFIKELSHEMVGVAQTGKEAISQCEVAKPEVILMDIHLDGELNGIETAKIIQEKFNVPVIFISSDIEDETVHKAIYHNTYGFLVKPVYKTTLSTAIEFAYSKHQFDQEHYRK